MTRLIDADALKEDVGSWGMNDYEPADFIDAIDNAPTASPKEICIANIHFDKEQLQEIVDKAIIRCKDCKHQKKAWHEDKRMKEKGYWIYGCNLIDDSFVGTPVWGEDNQFCSSAEKASGRQDDS